MLQISKDIPTWLFAFDLFVNQFFQFFKFFLAQIGFFGKERGKLTRTIVKEVFNEAIHVFGEIIFFLDQWIVLSGAAKTFIRHKPLIGHSL